MLFAMCLGGVTKAHPHVFVDARTGFVFGSDRQLEAIKVSWRYDEFTTLVLFETLEFDLDQDGQLNDADRVKILEGETNWPQDYKGDIYLEVLGQDYPLGRPKAAAVIIQNSAQIIPTPSDDLEVGKVCLPHLVNASGFVFELISGFNHHIIGRGDQICFLQNAVS